MRVGPDLHDGLLALSRFSLLVGLPVAMAVIQQILTASVLYRHLRCQDGPSGPSQ